MALLLKDKEVVAPGEIIANGLDYLPSTGTYRSGDDIRASKLGLLRVEGKVLKTIPLAGVYIPRKHDVIIGRIIDILMSGWRVDINGPYSAVLGIMEASFDFIPKGADLTKYFNLEDYAVMKITRVTTQKLIDVSAKGQGLHKLRGGRIIKVSPHKVPRIIGTKGSMISMIKKATGCKIIVGQNGLVWIDGAPDKEHIAVDAIKRVEELAHTNGLTDFMRSHLEKVTGVKIDSDNGSNSKGHQGSADQGDDKKENDDNKGDL